MDKKDTLFVLGAGASVDHGYPTGVQLLEDIVNFLENKAPFMFAPTSSVSNKQLVLILCALNESYTDGVFNKKLPIEEFEHYKKLIDDFGRRLKFSTPRSIDDFIHSQVNAESDNAQKERIKKLGKLLIVLRILQYEKKSKEYNHVTDFADNVYSRTHGDIKGQTVYKQKITFFTELWQNLYGGSYDDFLENLNKVNFITFNYDRLLEHFLYDSASHFFQPTPQQLGDLKERLKTNVHHVYGRLGSFLWENEKGMDYGAIDYASFVEAVSVAYIQVNESRNEADRNDKAAFSRVCKFLDRQSEDSFASRKLLDFVFSSISTIRTYTELEAVGEPLYKNGFQHMYFLGFSFHQLNLKAIAIRCRFDSLLQNDRPQRIDACVFGLKNSEIRNAALNVRRVLFGNLSKKEGVCIADKVAYKIPLMIPDFFKTMQGVRYINT